jgi:hypothetical protein
VILPQHFAANTVSLDPVRARAAVAAIVMRSGRQGELLTEDKVLDTLVKRYGMTHAVTLIRQAR